MIPQTDDLISTRVEITSAVEFENVCFIRGGEPRVAGRRDRFLQLLFATGIEGASNKLAPAASHAGCGAFDLIVRCA